MNSASDRSKSRLMGTRYYARRLGFSDSRRGDLLLSATNFNWFIIGLIGPKIRAVAGEIVDPVVDVRLPFAEIFE